MEYTSTIKSIIKKESFNTKDGAIMNKYVVQFVNGHNPNVFTTKELTYNVGDEVNYNLDQAKNKAKLMPIKTTNNYNNPKDDVQKYIIRQSSLNRSTDIHGPINMNNYDQEIEIRLQTARKFENYVYNG
tara:strand:- start:6731 stop:7117 length:387 start_codon:yes stop_codon:yes gene_type:complete